MEMVSMSIPQKTNWFELTSHYWKGCIQKVPDLLRQEEHNKRDYDPLVASFGPYHHGKPQLKIVEDFKPMALELFAAGSGKEPDFFLVKVVEAIQIHDLRRCYTENSTDVYDDAVFARMMLLDACFIVNYILMCVECHERMSKATIDHHEVFEAMINQLPVLRSTMHHLGSLVFSVLIRDMFLLENQVPFCLLKLLINLKWGIDEGEVMISKFLRNTIFREDNNTVKNDTQEPLHLLAALRGMLVAADKKQRASPSSDVTGKGKKIDLGRNFRTYFHTFPSVTDLKAKGVQFKPSLTNSFKGIKFKSSYFYGELQLPTFGISVYTKVFYLNLIAFETCPNNFTDQTVLTYINFMRSLIESPKDVKELREKHILINALGSDEEVMQVYKDINTFGANNYGMFYQVRQKIQEHCDNKAKTWVAELIHTYFSSPWTVIALLTALTFLCLSFLQTYFTILGK